MRLRGYSREAPPPLPGVEYPACSTYRIGTTCKRNATRVVRIHNGQDIARFTEALPKKVTVPCPRMPVATPVRATRVGSVGVTAHDGADIAERRRIRSARFARFGADAATAPDRHGRTARWAMPISILCTSAPGFRGASQDTQAPTGDSASPMVSVIFEAHRVGCSRPLPYGFAQHVTDLKS